MTAATLLPFLVFATVASITPGPNNILIMSTTATRGLRAGLPIILGVAFGFGFMVAVVGAGLAVPLARLPVLQTAMRWIGVAWLLVLAWRIARSPAVHLERADARPPMGFWAASAFQSVNPKAWIMAVATAATYTLAGIAPVGRARRVGGSNTYVGMFGSEWLIMITERPQLTTKVEPDPCGTPSRRSAAAARYLMTGPATVLPTGEF